MSQQQSLSRMNLSSGRRWRWTSLGIVCLVCSGLMFVGTSSTEILAAEGEDPLAVSAESDLPPRLPIPTADQIAAAQRVIEQVFGKDLAQARTPETRQKVATTLYRKAGETLVQDDPAGNYALLIRARELALQAGDLPLALRVIDRMGQDFSLDPLAEKTQLVQQQAGNAKSQIKPALFVDVLPGVMDQAISKEQFTVALELVKVAESAARKAKLTPHLKSLTERREEIKQLQQEWLSARTAAKTLVQNSHDAAAAGIVGRYLCLVRGDWDRGLSHLARSDDAALKKLAEQEAGAVETPLQQVGLADGWWDYADAMTPGYQQRQVYLHAGDWYLLAQPGLTGLQLSRLELRLQTVGSLRQTGAGNTDLAAGIDLVSLIPVDHEAQLLESSAADPRPPQRSLAGKPCTTWLFHHPTEQGTAVLRYDLRKQRSQWFEADIGIADGAKDLKTKLIFEVWGNGRRLWQSPGIGQTGTVEKCRVKITGITQLELRVVCPGSSRFAWSTWGNPRLIP